MTENFQDKLHREERKRSRGTKIYTSIKKGT